MQDILWRSNKADFWFEPLLSSYAVICSPDGHCRRSRGFLQSIKILATADFFVNLMVRFTDYRTWVAQYFHRSLSKFCYVWINAIKRSFPLYASDARYRRPVACMFFKCIQCILAYANLTYLNPRLSECHKYMVVNIITCLWISLRVWIIINVVHYLKHLHVIHLSELFTYLNTFLRPVATGFR